MNNQARGPLLMVVAMACYAGNDAIIKHGAQALDVGQLLSVRGSFAILLTLIFLPGAREFAAFRSMLDARVMLRCVLEVGTAWASVLALSQAPLATVAALAMLSPIVAMFLAVALRWERWSARGTAAAACGMAGTLLLVVPWHADAPSISGVLAALVFSACLAARDLVTRSLLPQVPTPMLALWTIASVALAGVGLSAFGAQPWRPLDPALCGWLAGASICAAGGNWLLIAACRSTTLGRVQPYRFTFLLWSTLLGAVVWAEWPDLPGWVGLALIASGGLTLRRSRADA